ncbi:MAG: threonine/serine exporter family protein [Ruminococcaceae bacterium]|nr:threonine/serine exporter family protein [Oscillospiraceae bacterium]
MNQTIQVNDMEQTKSNLLDAPDRVMACILDIGEVLLKGGAEIMRVEDTLGRLCRAYGFASSDVFTVTSCIILTARLPAGDVMTQTRRVPARGTDLDSVARANALSRRLCARPVPLEEMQAEIAALRQGRSYPTWLQLLTWGVVSAAFSLFFGGTAMDACAAFCSGLVLFCAMTLGSRLRINSILLSCLCSGLTALTVALLCAVGLGQHHDKIIIGNIMLLIPGMALTTSLRDVINGDTLSGMMGFFESIVKAMAVAIGPAVVLKLLGGF